MKFDRNQPRSQPIVRVASLGGPELVLLPSSQRGFSRATSGSLRPARWLRECIPTPGTPA
jgi:hypothetical protein